MVPNRPSMLRSWEWESPLHLASPKSEICNRAQAGGSAGCGAPRGVRPGPPPGPPEAAPPSPAGTRAPQRETAHPAQGRRRAGRFQFQTARGERGLPGRGLGQAGYAPRTSWAGGRVAASALKGTALRKPCEVSELAPRAASAPPGTFCDQRALAGACTKHTGPRGRPDTHLPLQGTRAAQAPRPTSSPPGKGVPTAPGRPQRGQWSGTDSWGAPAAPPGPPPRSP